MLMRICAQERMGVPGNHRLKAFQALGSCRLAHSRFALCDASVKHQPSKKSGGRVTKHKDSPISRLPVAIYPAAFSPLAIDLSPGIFRA